MIVTKTKTAPVDVAAAMREADTSVMEQARARFDANVVTYREGVRRMAESEGKLPADEADVLLRACRDLDIPAERMEADITTIIRHGRVAERAAEIHGRNLERAERVARLEAEMVAERERWLTVKRECDLKLREAEERMEPARRAFEQASRIPDERADEHHVERRRLEEQAPHLFNSVEPEQLRRIIRPPAAGIHPWK